MAARGASACPGRDRRSPRRHDHGYRHDHRDKLLAGAAGPHRNDHSIGQQHDRAAIQPFCTARSRRACRARVAGEWKRPLAAMADEIATSAKLLADVAPDLIVFHCTDTSMTQGPQGEGAILKIVQDALQALGLRRLVLLSPYKSNQAVIDYLGATGFTVVHDVALALKSLEFATVTPREWVELARKHDRAEADGIFLSCTNTTQIEAIADIEQALGKPVVNSNQAVLWGCVKRLKSALAPLPPMPSLGRLMRHMDA